MAKKTTPPRGAEVLYSGFEVEWRGGVVRVVAVSGDYAQRGSMTLASAMTLHHKLGATIAEAIRRPPKARKMDQNQRAHVDGPS